uniref:Uncharacterized protein n=1 Tax=Octopus bimaculoides TaxID=37653 RepID=A0A0L8IBW7_OCTBM
MQHKKNIFAVRPFLWKYQIICLPISSVLVFSPDVKFTKFSEGGMHYNRLLKQN